MSLGLNLHRNPRMTNLPGSVGGAIITTPAPFRRRSPNKVQAERLLRAAPTSTIAAPVPPAQPRASVPAVAGPKDEAQHWMYATCVDALCDRNTGSIVANAGERVLLVYPMTETADGVVHMRAKCVHAVTGQLRYADVDVFNKTTDEAYVEQFSLVP